MTQYKAMIEKKRKQLLAEEWAQGVEHMHLHSLNSMWYEPNPIKIKSRKVGYFKKSGKPTLFTKLEATNVSK